MKENIELAKKDFASSSVPSSEASLNDQAALMKLLESISQQLKEHWVYDVAELFTDCAVATYRISTLIDEIKRDPQQIADRKILISALNDFAKFDKWWRKQEKNYLSSGDVICPDAVKDFVDRIQAVGVAANRRATLKREHQNENYNGSLETVQQIRNPLS